MNRMARRTWPCELGTSRLTLRPALEDDRPDIIRLVTDSSARDFFGGAVAFGSPQALQLSPLGLTWGHWIIADRFSNQMLGMLNLSDDRDALQITFALLPEHRGRGYAGEAIREVIEWATRTDQAEDLIAVLPARNKPALQLLGDLGFRRRRGFEEFGTAMLLLFRPLVSHSGAQTPHKEPPHGNDATRDATGDES